MADLGMTVVPSGQVYMLGLKYGGSWPDFDNDLRSEAGPTWPSTRFAGSGGSVAVLRGILSLSPEMEIKEADNRTQI